MNVILPTEKEAKWLKEFDEFKYLEKDTFYCKKCEQNVTVTQRCQFTQHIKTERHLRNSKMKKTRQTPPPSVQDNYKSINQIFVNFNVNIGILLDMCGILYTDDQLMKLEKLLENFIQKIIGSRNNENEKLKEEFEENSVKIEMKENVELELEDDISENTENVQGILELNFPHSYFR